MFCGTWRIRVVLLDDSNPLLTVISSLKFCALKCGETSAYEQPDKSTNQGAAEVKSAAFIKSAIDYFYLVIF